MSERDLFAAASDIELARRDLECAKHALDVARFNLETISSRLRQAARALTRFAVSGAAEKDSG